jgi:hypothetical protein
MPEHPHPSHPGSWPRCVWWQQQPAQPPQQHTNSKTRALAHCPKSMHTKYGHTGTMSVQLASLCFLWSRHFKAKQFQEWPKDQEVGLMCDLYSPNQMFEVTALQTFHLDSQTRN